METLIRDIKGLEGFEGYTINEEGEVKSYLIKGMNRKYDIIDWEITPTIVKPSIKSSGYKHLGLADKNGVTKYFMVHRLLALAFIPNDYNKKQVNHIDGNKLNNSLDNLEWATPSENIIHSHKIGAHDKRIEQTRVKVNQYDKDGNFIKSTTA